MLKSPVLKAKATPKPVIIIGVDVTIAHPIFLGLLNTPKNRFLKPSIGSNPAITRTKAPTKSPKSIDIMVKSILDEPKLFLLFTLFVIYTSCHKSSYFKLVCLFRILFSYDFTIIDYEDPI